MSPFPEFVSGKIGRTNKEQPGQIAGAAEPLLATIIPATNVPCLQAALLDRAQLPPFAPGNSRTFWLSKSGWPFATGPSIKPIVTSERPAARVINGESSISSKAVISVLQCPCTTKG